MLMFHLFILGVATNEITCCMFFSHVAESDFDAAIGCFKRRMLQHLGFDCFDVACFIRIVYVLMLHV